MNVNARRCKSLGMGSVTDLAALDRWRRVEYPPMNLVEYSPEEANTLRIDEYWRVKSDQGSWIDSACSLMRFRLDTASAAIFS